MIFQGSGGGPTFSRGVQLFPGGGGGGPIAYSHRNHITCNFPGGGGPDPCPPLWIRTWNNGVARTLKKLHERETPGPSNDSLQLRPFSKLKERIRSQRKGANCCLNKQFLIVWKITFYHIK